MELSKLKTGKSTSENMTGQLGDLENITRALGRASNAESMQLTSLTPFPAPA